MGLKLKKYMICVCAMVVIGGFPAMAAPDSEVPVTETDSSSDNNVDIESDKGAGSDQETSEPETTPAENEADGKGGKVPGGSSGLNDGRLSFEVKNVPEDAEEGTAGWLTKDALIKAGAGFGAGISISLVIFCLWLGAMKRAERKRKERARKRTEQQQQEMVPTVKEIKDVSREEQTVTEDSRQAHAAGVQMPVLLPDSAGGSFGKVHNTGCRRNQQDTMGTAATRLGFLAVVSDGMGGLSDGEKVSRQAVEGMLQAAGRVAISASENPLFVMLAEANEQVLQMLGPGQVYKSGATLLAVLVNNRQFHWVAVGDSRIYFYCSHHLFQLNREHIYKQQLIGEAVNKNISFSRVATDPQRDRLVSFLGMGELKYVDGSLRPVDVKQGDKLLLMSDGIFNTISEGEIIRILESTRNAAEAAAHMEQQVLAANNPKQDNFTCVILDF